MSGAAAHGFATRSFDASRVAIVADGEALDIEVRWIDGPADAPLVVFLHEGLGSVAMWKDFPDRLCAAAGCRGLVYSRPGYGASTPRPHHVQWSADYLHRQAEHVLPALLAALDLAESPWLFGHSDGGSIALIHAALFPSRVAGLVVMAPHLDVEQVGVDSIAKARVAYLETDLRDKLARHHADVDSAFWGWNDVWLSEPFSHFDIRALLPRIACPILAIQGHDDQYGTMAHIDGIRDALPDTVLVKLERCGHSPHRDQPQAVIDAVTAFIASHPDQAAHHATSSPASQKARRDRTDRYRETP
jgi:pimeloyl-ACP methyl ester carboxylesterase